MSLAGSGLKSVAMRTGVIPGLVYDDAMAAIDFLCEAFGFTRQLVVPGPAGTVAHAQLVLGEAMVMLGSAGPGQRERGQVTPAEAGGMVTSGLYMIVADPDGHHARSAASGARIVDPPSDKEYGGRGYAARDIGGYIWSFGSYNPWAERV